MMRAAAATCLLVAAGATPAGAQTLAQLTLAQPSNTQLASPYGYFAKDEQTYIHGIFNELEGRLNGQGSYLRWDGDVWAGTDENRLWLKSEGRQYGNGRTEDGQQQAFYDRPISRFWDVQAGTRYDLDSRPGRAWAALGVQGLAPDFADVSATLYASDGGHYAARLNAYYDLFLTQFLVAEPQIELNAYSSDDRARLVGAGLSDMDAGLRLRYEFSRKLAPYVGVAWYRQFGGTASLAREAGEQPDDLRFLFGIRTWF